MDLIGARRAFALFSLCSLGTLVLYFVYVNLVYICSRLRSSSSNRAVPLQSPVGDAEDERPLVNNDADEDSFGSEDEIFHRHVSTNVNAES